MKLLITTLLLLVTINLIFAQTPRNSFFQGTKRFVAADSIWTYTVTIHNQNILLKEYPGKGNTEIKNKLKPTRNYAGYIKGGRIYIKYQGDYVADLYKLKAGMLLQLNNENEYNEYIEVGRKPTPRSTVDDDIFVAVDEEPSFPGGIVKFLNYINQHINFSKFTENDYFNRMMLTFVVEADGSLSQIKALGLYDEKLYKLILPIIARSPKWNPGMYQGIARRVQFTTPLIVQKPQEPAQ